MKQLNTRWKDLFKRSKNIRKKKKNSEKRNFSEKHYVLILNTFGIKGTDERHIVIMINGFGLPKYFLRDFKCFLYSG